MSYKYPSFRILDARKLASRIAICANIFTLFGGFWIFEGYNKYFWSFLIFGACILTTFCYAKVKMKGNYMAFQISIFPISFLLLAQLISLVLIAIIPVIPVYVGLIVLFPLCATLSIKRVEKQK